MASARALEAKLESVNVFEDSFEKVYSKMATGMEEER